MNQYLAAMKQALEALESANMPNNFYITEENNLRNAIAEMEKAEPVAWQVAFKEIEGADVEYALDTAKAGREYLLDRCKGCDLYWIGEPEPLYTHPQQQTIPEDWQLVPKELPSEVAHEVWRQGWSVPREFWECCIAMLAAAPKLGDS